MWPEPSVSCLISRPLPGSHGQATFAPRALPREGPAEEENHFSRLASPGRAFLPRPVPKQPQETGLGPARPEVPTFRALRLQAQGLRPVLGPQRPRPLRADAFLLQSQSSPRRAGSVNLFMFCQISCLGFRLQSWSISSVSVHAPAPSHLATIRGQRADSGGLGRPDARLAQREGPGLPWAPAAALLCLNGLCGWSEIPTLSEPCSLLTGRVRSSSHTGAEGLPPRDLGSYMGSDHPPEKGWLSESSPSPLREGRRAWRGSACSLMSPRADLPLLCFPLP